MKADISLCSSAFLDLVARCIDLDWSLFSIVSTRMAAVVSQPDPRLSDCVHLDIVEGLLCFHRSEYDGAFVRFVNASELAQRMSDRDLFSLSLYYAARSEWKLRRYKPALERTLQAKSAAIAASLEYRIGLIEMLEGWLRFLEGEYEAAERLISRAFTNEHDDVTKADILSFNGRRARQAGSYDDALARFDEAISEYSRFNEHYRNVGRCHQNIAYVRYLQICDANNEDARRNAREVDKLKIDATRHSAEAEKIYRLYPERTRVDLAKLFNDRALLQNELGELEQAIESAEAAYELSAGHPDDGILRPIAPGQLKTADLLVMADSRVIRCMIAIDNGQPMEALAYARHAMYYASATEDRRGRARAYVWLAFSLVERPIEDPLEADRLFLIAEELLQPDMKLSGTKDYLVRDLGKLRKTIDQCTWNSDLIVARVTNGTARRRPLDEILADVERDIVRHVYRANKQNASKTADELRIGDERVRKWTGRKRV